MRQNRQAHCINTSKEPIAPKSGSLSLALTFESTDASHCCRTRSKLVILHRCCELVSQIAGHTCSLSEQDEAYLSI